MKERIMKIKEGKMGRLPEFPAGRITKRKYEHWYREMVLKGLAYHPEDGAHSIVSAECPDGLFTREEVDALDGFMETVNAYIKDPCAIAMKVHRELDAA